MAFEKEFQQLHADNALMRAELRETLGGNITWMQWAVGILVAMFVGLASLVLAPAISETLHRQPSSVILPGKALPK